MGLDLRRIMIVNINSNLNTCLLYWGNERRKERENGVQNCGQKKAKSLFFYAKKLRNNDYSKKQETS